MTTGRTTARRRGLTITGSLVIAGCLALVAGCATGEVSTNAAPGHAAPTVTATTTQCVLPPGELTVEDLPPGSSVVACDAVGRTVRWKKYTFIVPEIGHATSMHADGVNPSSSYSTTISVTQDGIVSYEVTDSAGTHRP